MLEMSSPEYSASWIRNCPECCSIGQQYFRDRTTNQRTQLREYQGHSQAWVDVVAGALEEYAATQHLIGTQLVRFDDLQTGPDGVVGGKASMTSYLQAWHEHKDGHVWVFIGTYEDEIKFVPETGWRISSMTLFEVTSERRPLGDLEIE